MARRFNGPATYAEALTMLKGKSARKVGNNTHLSKQGEVIVLRLHATDILTFYPDGSRRLASGGYRTATTKHRLQGCDINLSQKNFDWFVDGKPFYENMLV